MTTEISPWSLDGTTAALTCSAPGRPLVFLMIAGAILNMPGTSSSVAGIAPDQAVLAGTDATSSGPSIPAMDMPPLEAPVPASASTSVAELRILGGLTWDQVARLFGVSRRSVHFWASGKPMATEHEEHLYRLLALFREIRVPADVMRGRLLAVSAGGQVLDLLANHKYREAEETLRSFGAQGRVHPTSPRIPLSDNASRARQPLPPDVLASTEEPIDPPITGRSRAVRTRRSKGSGHS